jgi:aarF domain-containing kinase
MTETKRRASARGGKQTRRVPQTVFGRSLRLLGGGAGILAREIGSRVSHALSGHEKYESLKVRLKQAEALVATLGQLKGAAMKAGQLLSLELSDLLPPEVTEVLRQLHDSAPSLDFDAVTKILRKELGAERFARLESISPEPIAAASIGQVHGARLNGRDVVLKIQFPGVAASIDSDLKLLKTLTAGFLRLQGKAIAIDPLFAEIRRGLKAEVDYVKEAQALAAYREAFAGDERYLIPEVYPEMSTHKVLTMERVGGIKLSDWLATEPPQEESHALAELILGLLVKEFFEAGLVQTDPNYGNFFYEPEKRRLILLDFGAVQRYSKKFRQEYRRLLNLAMTGDPIRIWEQAVQMGFLDEREGELVQALFLEVLELSVSMFRAESQPFDFGDSVYIEKVRNASLELIRRVEHTAPPRQLIFLNRKLGGMFHLLKDAGCRVDLSRFWPA